MKSFLLLLLSLLLHAKADAQISLVADLVPGPNSSAPIQLTSFNGKLYFNANVPATGRELYVYDGNGTPALVHDMTPGTGGFVNADIEEDMAVLNGVMYFAGSTPATGGELFRYMGSGVPSLAGPEIAPGTTGSMPACIRVIGGYVYFAAWTYDYGVELYRYDPIADSSTRLTDLRSSIYSSSPTEITGYKGRIYFKASGDDGLNELYAYDPVGDTAYLVADLNPGFYEHSNPKFLTVLGDTLYFAAQTLATGAEIFAYAGAGAPVHRTDLAPGVASGVLMGGTSTAIGILAYNNALYFIGANSTTGYQLFRYTPATGQTTLAYEFKPGGSDIHLGAVHDGALYLAASSTGAGQELWRYTPSSTAMVMELSPGAGSSLPTSFCSWNGALYFSATNGSSGLELFRLDGTVAVPMVQENSSPHLFPNPASERIHITWLDTNESPASVIMYDAAGRCVLSTNISDGGTQATSISIAALPAGTHMMDVRAANGAQLICALVTKQ